MRTLLTLLNFLFLGITYAQQGTVLLSKKQLKIGEPFTLVYKISLKTPEKLQFNAASKTLPYKLSNSPKFLQVKSGREALEIRNKFRDTTIKTSAGFEWIGIYELIAWDSGFYQLPIQQAKLGKKIIQFPISTFEVRLTSKIPGKTLFDIEEVALEKPSLWENIKTFLKRYAWIFGLTALILIITLIWKKRKKKALFLGHHSTPESIALAAIDTLNEKRLWEANQLKLHYVELSMVLRQFISSIYALNFLERTTTETTMLLKEKRVNPEAIILLIQLLEEADLVKFAKSKPEKEEVIARSNQAKTLIKQLYSESTKQHVD